MFELVVMLTRYLFIFYILYFLWQCFVYVMYEHGYELGIYSMTKQRISIIFLHITAFLILAYKPTQYRFDSKILLIGAAYLIFFVYAKLTSDRLYRSSCPLVWNCIFFLFDVSIITLQRLNPLLAQRQLIWIFIGFTATLFIPLVLKIFVGFDKLKFLYLGIGIALLLSPFLIGVSQYGATNWITIGSVTFQPSEIVKFLYIFYLSTVFCRIKNFKEIIIPTAVSVFFVLILTLQRDLGGALIFFMTFMIMAYISTGSTLFFVSGISAATCASFLMYQIFPHIQVRVQAWINPWIDIDNGGYQITQSLFSITTWGFIGSGLTRGYAKTIPIVEKDFIFAAICEEFGSLFGVCLVIIFIVLYLRCMLIALRCDIKFFSIIAAGMTSMLAFQTFIILGGVIKLVPLTGVTLPFMSYGGTSVVASILMIGILQWIRRFHS